mgnify:CR=1 FL=1
MGPDRLGLDGALGDGSAELETVLALTIREGVVGETVAACEAAELSDIAQGRLAEVLARIDHDAASHARLALAFVDDALSRFGARAHAVVAGEIALIEEELRRFGHAQVEATEQEIQLERYGLVSDARRAELRRETLARAVLPVLRTLLAERARLAA